MLLLVVSMSLLSSAVLASSDRGRDQQQQQQRLSASSAVDVFGRAWERPISGGCLGLKAQDCKPCPSGETNACESVTAECGHEYCSPLCLASAWRCEVTVDAASASGKNFSAAVSAAERKALCAQVLAQACASFECCVRDDVGLLDWVEAAAYADSFPAPLLPFATCSHDPLDAAAARLACGKCKSTLGIKLTASPDACERLGATTLPPPPPAPASGAAATKPPKSAAAANTKGGGTMKSLSEMCLNLSKKIEEKIVSVISDVKSRLCACAGCCDEALACFYPLTNSPKKP